MRIVWFVLWMVVNSYGCLLGQPKLVKDPLGTVIGRHLKNNPTSPILVETFDSTTFFKAISGRYPFLHIKKVGANLFRISNLRRNTVAELLASGRVRYLDRADRTAREETLLGDFDLGVNSVTTTHSLYPSVNGEGYTVSIKEKPFDVNDIDIKGRIKLNNQFDEPSTLHATIMATIAAGAGNSSPIAKGVAWGASVTTSDFGRLLPDEDSHFSTLNVSVQNHSYGVGLENYYGIESKEYDALCIRRPQLLHVFSSGNLGDQTPSEGVYAGINSFANLTGQFKVSKNTMAVGTSDRFGNVVARSSRGPSYDGRIKPELIAFGDAGSSEAAAVVSGGSLLLQDYYTDLFGVMPDAALLKAILINSADDTGRPNVDFESGFGSLDLLGAFETIEEAHFFSGLVGQDGKVKFLLDVPPEQKELKVTLVWHDPPAEPFNLKGLINDIDLTVRNTVTNEIFAPWVLNASPSAESLSAIAHRGPDHLNNVEQVTIELPEAGSYELGINGYSISQGPQSFFIAYETRTGFEWILPVEENAIQTGRPTIVRWKWNYAAATGTLEYRKQGSSQWNLINSNIDMATNAFEWFTPTAAGVYQLRFAVQNEQWESAVFPISSPARLEVGFDCSEAVLLQWPRTASSTEYVVYALGEKFLEPILHTQDTFALFSKDKLTTHFFSFAPVFGNMEGQREFTVDYTQQGVGCYFISFLPRESISSTSPVLDVTLGTTYQLASATLERIAGDLAEPIVVDDQVEARNFSFTDPNPRPGFNTYRIKLTTLGGGLILSDEVEVFFVRESDLYIFPNPVLINNDISIIVGDEGPAEISLFDVNGRFVKNSADFGTVKVISTEDLVKGAYLVRVKRSGGQIVYGKVIVL